MAAAIANQSTVGTAEGVCIAPTPLISVVAPLVAIVLVASCCITATLRRSWKKRTNKLLKDREARLEERVNAAIHSTHQLNHPAVFLSGTDFVQLGKLLSFEKLRNQGKLKFCDTYADLINTRQYIVFISHQWVSFNHPDPKQEQYEVMVAAVKRVASELKGVSIRASNPGHSCAHSTPPLLLRGGVGLC